MTQTEQVETITEPKIYKYLCWDCGKKYKASKVEDKHNLSCPECKSYRIVVINRVRK